MTRVVSAVVLGALVIYLIAAAPLLLGALAVLAVVLAGAHEMARLLEACGRGVPRIPTIAASILLVAGAWSIGVTGLSAGLAAGVALIHAAAVLRGEVKGSAVWLSSGILVLLYPSWSLSHVILYLHTGPGRKALLFLLLCVWACDSAAYYTGSALGRRKLAPELSPNKTVAGAVGGTIGGAGAAFILRTFGLVSWPVLSVLGAGLFLAVLAQIGDLAESMIKRDAGVKDSGSVIPGHGGILDRVDALLFAAPVFYYILLFSGGLV